MTTPKERPILFSVPMVRAILDGTKTQTRRVCKLQAASDYEYGGAMWTQRQAQDRCPYGIPGDRLWVRETWRVGAWRTNDHAIAVDYRADGCVRLEWLPVPRLDQWSRLWAQSTDDARAAGVPLNDTYEYRWKPGESPCRWRPSIHMPRWASRITLEVTGVRVERVQDISHDDALAEGIDTRGIGTSWEVREQHARIPFARLWDTINAKRGHAWESNPWVWVVEFRRIKP